MKSNDLAVMSLRDYQMLGTEARTRYLDLHTGSSTELSEDFLRHALKWETSSLAKWYIIRALGLVRSEKAIDSLIETCKETDVDFGNTSLHLITAWSLGQLGPVAFPFVLDALRSTTEIETKRCLVDALGEIRSEQAIPLLAEVFATDHQSLKLWSALSLAKIGKPALLTLYSLLSESVHWRDKVYLLDAICKVNDPGSREVIRNVLYNGTDEEKRFIVEKCSAFFDDSFVEPLELLCTSESPELSSLARHALEMRN